MIDVAQFEEGYPLRSPEHDSTPNGMAWAWDESFDLDDSRPKERQFVTIVWHDHSSGTGEYRAVRAKWRLDEKEQVMYLQHVNVKEKYSPWDEFLTEPAARISTRHLALAQAVARSHFGMGKFKSRTYMHPKE